MFDITPTTDSICEYLRDQFFNGKRGCYETFETKNDVQFITNIYVDWTLIFNLPKLIYSQDTLNYDEKWPWYIKFIQGIEVQMVYMWDGDGTLVFQVMNKVYVNSDCKKNYGWIVSKYNSISEYLRHNV